MFALDMPILVVDDMSTMRKIVIKECKGIGFTNFAEAADGKIAWETLNASPFGLVISDWNMPNCTGLDLLKRVRGDTRFKHLPFLLVTAEAEKSQIVEALQAAVSGYVVKPFPPGALRKQLEQIYLKIAGGQPASKKG